ncbi:MAG TPA: YafY family protein [Acidimicrobiia bacterium]|nr:YafY family protein [Acidimicrobiia bacterium]
MDPSGRMLKLLSLLQARPNWTGEELAERLGVTSRTLRRDVNRLRDLGYPVEAISGPAGGYQLAPGGALPPLLLDDQEAVTVVLSLRTAASGSLPGFEDAAIAALAKIEQVLPRRLNEQIANLEASMVGLARRTGSPPAVTPEALLHLAQACRRQERLRFTYVDVEGNVTERHVEPFQLVHTGRRWYLVARDRDREAWRTFRIDRISRPATTGLRFVLDNPPDAAALVAEGLAVSSYALQAKVMLKLPYEQALKMISPTVGVLERKRGGTLLRIGADELGWVAGYLAGLACEFRILDPPELKKAVADLGTSLIRLSV